LGGKIDRIDKLAKDKYFIIDYKTGSSSKKRDPETDLQLSIYALAAVNTPSYNITPEMLQVGFYFLEDQTTVSAGRTKEQLDEAREKINTIIETMKESTYKPNPGKHCDFCQFKMICEAWQ
jgi:DNA helicase-2/ATP-dependent DNA helicase PcrA